MSGLGKFNPSKTRSRPLLLKLTRIIDVDNVLFNRSNISNGILVKPDMNHEERHRKSILLKERWSLMNSELTKSTSKSVALNLLFVKDLLHGEIIGSVFVMENETELTPSDNNSAMELGDKPAPDSN